MLKKYIRRSPRTASRIWGNVAVVVALKRYTNVEENVFQFGADEAYIWKLLEEQPSAKEIILNVAKKKKASFNSVKKEVIMFIKLLAAEDLVEILDKK